MATGNAGARIACGLVVEMPSKKQAEVNLQNGLEGKLHLTQNGPRSPVIVEGIISRLEKGHHGFHIHQGKEIGEDCKVAGGHFNPFDANHGSPDASDRHVGDLGNIITSGDETLVYKVDSLASLYPGQSNVLGRAVVVHASIDDLGLGEAESSLKTGNAGGRVGCGLIEEKNQKVIAGAPIAGENGVTGSILLTQDSPATPVKISGQVRGLSPGKHGFHIHQIGSIEDKCKAAGGHYNPMMVREKFLAFNSQ